MVSGGWSGGVRTGPHTRQPTQAITSTSSTATSIFFVMLFRESSPSQQGRDGLRKENQDEDDGCGNQEQRQAHSAAMHSTARGAMPFEEAQPHKYCRKAQQPGAHRRQENAGPGGPQGSNKSQRQAATQRGQCANHRGERRGHMGSRDHILRRWSGRALFCLTAVF
jgi:hypothetical protein